MSMADVVVRVQHLQQLIQGHPADAPSSAKTSFADTLASAGSAPGAPASTTTPVAFGATPSAAGDVSGVPFSDDINAAAARHKLDPALLAGLIRQESNFNPNAVSPVGARGLTQLMPGTAAGLGVGDPTDPTQAIEGGARYLRQQLDRFGNDPARALAAYNAGPGAVLRHGGVPPYAETQGYVRKVQEYAAEFRRASPAVSAAQPLATPQPLPIAGAVGGLGYSTF